MKEVYHSADSRGASNLGWLKSKHSFSFADYYCPERVQFGALRVLNDDIVKPGMGFGTHPHQDMEIISIPIYGALAHKDSKGHAEIINPDDVQVMSAGTGIMHSEYNASLSEEVNFLQIWIIPEENGVNPRYDQKSFGELHPAKGIELLVAPFGTENEALKIHQKAYLSRVALETGQKLDYQKYRKENGLYLFLIEGQVVVGDQILSSRDGLGLPAQAENSFAALENSSVLILEVPNI